MQTKPTVDQLNQIQSEWMKLDSSVSNAEKQKVFKAMASLPKSFLSVSSDLANATPFVNESPCWAESRPIAEAIKFLQSPSIYNARIDVAWCGAIGQWVTVS